MAYPKTLIEFYNQLRERGVKLNHQFQLRILNTGIQSIDTALEDVSMWAQGSAVPGRTQEFGEIPYLGYNFQVPTKMTMTQDLELTLFCESDLKIHDALLTWHGIVSDADIKGGSAGGGIKRASQAIGILDLFNEKMDTVTHSYVLEGLSPQEIGTIELSNADVAIAQFTASFKYQFWYTEKTPNEF